MPKKRAAVRTKKDRPGARGKAAGRSPLGQLLHLLVSTPLRQVLLVAIILAVLCWQWSNIEAAWASLVALYGWGLVLLAVAFAAVVWVLWA